MRKQLSRVILQDVVDRLQNNPAVALLGPRQCGKSTLARMILEQIPDTLMLDLERPADRAVLEEAESFFDANSNRLICLDEVQRLPELFPVLRYMIDKRGTDGQFLLLGSASRDLIESASESLAGRIHYLEMTPFSYDEVDAESSLNQYWIRGGFPRSVLAGSDAVSMEWRQEFIRSFLERDLLQIKSRLSPERARRLWMMVAHCHGRILNKAQLAFALDVDTHTVSSYLDVLEAAFMIRRLPAFHANLGKRLVKSPKIFVRDSGLLHALLGIADYNALLAHPMRGFSWEGLVLDQILARLHPLAEASFYRTAKGVEVDLVVECAGRKTVLEIKASSSPKPEKGFWTGLDDLSPDSSLLIAPVEHSYTLKDKLDILSLPDLIRRGQSDGWLR